MATIATKPQARGWAVDDLVTRLRVWGTDEVHDLIGAREWTIGAAAECNLRLVD